VTALHGTLGATTPASVAATTISASSYGYFTGAGAPSGTGDGVEVKAGNILSYNRSGSAYTNLAINAGTLALQSNGNATTVGGTLSTTGVATFPAGTVALPSITTSGDTNTGIYFPAADTIAFTEGGAEAMRITSAGNVGIGTSSPTTTLAVTGTLSATSSLSVGETITSLQTNNATVLNAASATTGYQIAINAQNTGGRLNFGLEGSTGGSLASGDSAYDTVLTTIGATGVAIGANQVIVGRFSSTGLAVTGISTVAATASQTNLASLLLSTTATTHYLGGKVTVGLGGTESGLYYGGEGSANLQFSGSTARAAIVAAIGANPLQLGSNGTIYASLSSTGLAVTGLVDISAATSGQIKFPATQNASTNANTLDDYEEGTWTPSLGGTATYLAQTGRYTKIGRLVFIRGTILINVLGTGSTTAISGLPFTAVNSNPLSVQVGGSAVTFSAIYARINGTSVFFTKSDAAASSNQTSAAIFQAGTYVDLCGCYEI
jgi:hypothetical protein